MENIKDSKETNKEEKPTQLIEKKEEIKESTKKEEISIKNIKKSYKWVIVFIVIFIVSTIVSTGFAIINIKNENIISGVTIDNINLQGLNKEEVKAIIENKIEEKLNQEIKIKIDNEEYSLLLSQIELQYETDAVIELAHSVGRKGNIFENNFVIIKSKLKGENIKLDYKYNEELLYNIVKGIKEKIPNAVKQSTYCIEDDKLIITKGAEGLTIDEEELKEKIIKNINLSSTEVININSVKVKPDDINIEKIHEEVFTEPKDAYYTTNPFKVYAEVKGIDFDVNQAKELLKENKEEYEISLTITKPTKTIDQIGTEAFPDMLSTCSTRYDASDWPRTTNLKLAVNKINGKVVMPGETFSYNKTLGKRTAEAGYKEAAGYSGGKVVPMIGGGICQISSTLYDAIVYANLEIVERYNHMFKTSYLGAGKDATVVYGRLDFQFKNNRNYPIKINASAENGIAKITIYGIKEETEYDIEITTTILNYIPFKVIYENDASLPEGTEKVTQNGANGFKSITYKILKLNGAEVSRSVLSTDTYEPMHKYVTRGTKKVAQVVAPVEPAVPETSLEPEMPVEPVTPEVPEQPSEPEMPEGPDTSGTLTEPEGTETT